MLFYLSVTIRTVSAHRYCLLTVQVARYIYIYIYLDKNETRTNLTGLNFWYFRKAENRRIVTWK